MRHHTSRGRVVVEVDDVSDGFRVIEYAAAEACRADARLDLVRPYPDETHREEALDELRDAVTHVRRKLEAQLPVRTIAREGTRSAALTDIAGNARMLVIGRQRARGPYRVVASRSDLALAAMAPCPVVVVPRSWRPSVPERLVVVGVDGIPEAVEYAFATATGRAAQLVAVPAEPGTGGLGPVVEALLHESGRADLLVLGVRPNDPVACHALAAATCPVAMVHG